MDLPTNEQILAIYRGLTQEHANRKALSLQVQEQGNLCGIFLVVALDPSFIPDIMADGILIGMAIAEARQLEALHSLEAKP